MYGVRQESMGATKCLLRMFNSGMATQTCVVFCAVREVVITRAHCVALRMCKMPDSVSLDGGKVEWGSQGLAALFASRQNAFSPSFFRMLREMDRFNCEAPRLLLLDDDDPRKASMHRTVAERYTLLDGRGPLSCGFPLVSESCALCLTWHLRAAGNMRT